MPFPYIYPDKTLITIPGKTVLALAAGIISEFYLYPLSEQETETKHEEAGTFLLAEKKTG